MRGGGPSSTCCSAQRLLPAAATDESSGRASWPQDVVEQCGDRESLEVICDVAERSKAARLVRPAAARGASTMRCCVFVLLVGVLVTAC